LTIYPLRNRIQLIFYIRYYSVAKLTAGSTTIPVGGSVTLSCSVEPSAGWKYRWFRRTSDTSVEFSKNFKENSDITVTQGGIYRCEGERGNPVVVTRQPNSSQMFSGETITLTCEVQGGETTEWTCEWKRDGSIIPGTHSKDWTFIVSESSSGDYMCQCRRRDDWFSSTHKTISLTKPRAALTAGSTTIPVGGSVTLRCLIESSVGWKYRWFRQISSTSEEISTGNEENRVITVRQGGIYWCEGQRGNPPFFSQPSYDVIIEKTCEFCS
uniref:Ig-like domain-containing protein n=1 Tax=Poecilia reticulata TaxID=8081 RepID=A0A3P9N0M1_POERE